MIRNTTWLQHIIKLSWRKAFWRGVWTFNLSYWFLSQGSHFLHAKFWHWHYPVVYSCHPIFHDFSSAVWRSYSVSNSICHQTYNMILVLYFFMHSFAHLPIWNRCEQITWIWCYVSYIDKIQTSYFNILPSMLKGLNIGPSKRIQHFTRLPFLWRCKNEKYRNFVTDVTEIISFFGSHLIHQT